MSSRCQKNFDFFEKYVYVFEKHVEYDGKLMDLDLIGAIFCIICGLGVFADLESQVGDHSNEFKVPEEF